jgi:hypothetical protein
MVALIATLSIMMIGMYVAAPSWVYLIRYDREQQLIYEGFQIVKAIRAYQVQPGGPVTSIKQLVDSKKLREADGRGDPMIVKNGKRGKWRRISEPIPAICMPAAQQQGANFPNVLPPESEGPFIGVMTRFEGESYGIFNNKNRYEQWCFAATDLIPPTIKNLAYLRVVLMRVPQGAPPPKFKGGGDKLDPHADREPPELGTGRGGGAPTGLFEEPAAPGF